MTTWNTGDVFSAAFLNAIPRANNAQEDLVQFYVPLSQWRYADGDPVNATGAAGDPKLVSGGYGTGTIYLQGEDAFGTTKTETVMFEFRLPESYVAAETLELHIRARYSDTGTGVMSAKTIDAEIYSDDLDATVSADLCATSAQTLTTSFADYTFQVTETNLTAGSLLRIFIRIVLTESGGSGAQKAEIAAGGIYADIKG